MSRAVLIAGPTATGKSALALDLARAIGGVIVNADSMQVYKDLAVLTARPAAADLATAPHALYGHVEGAETYSAGRFVRELATVLSEAAERGSVPIIVGGTGLYFRAALVGLSEIPPVPDAVRRRWRARADEIGPQALHQELAARDPQTAPRLADTDRQRVVRALEVLEATGRSISDWQRTPGRPLITLSQSIPILLSGPRSALHARADARFLSMLDAGAIEEVRALAALERPPDAMVLRAVGVRPIARYIDGSISRASMIAEAQAETRQYIKRQETWFRKYMSEWNRVHFFESCAERAKFLSLLKTRVDAMLSRA
ncbi:MAG: tRNA (adenosine(37)-N6)-dimethylallyltransferase MiaA [Hyphomicrobiaceae bacterium]